jgi:hypothetical protein
MKPTLHLFFALILSPSASSGKYAAAPQRPANEGWVLGLLLVASRQCGVRVG